MAASEHSPLTLLATLSSPTGHGTRTWQSRAHPSPSVPLLATASSDKSVHIYSLKDFKLVSTISGGHKRSVRCVEWKDYGRPRKRLKADGAEGRSGREKQKVTLATGSFDANVGIWEHNSSYKSTTGTRDDDNDGDEHMQDLETDLTNQASNEDSEEWNFTTLLTGPDSEIKSITFSPPHYSANLLATSSRDKSVWVWEEVEDEEWETVAVCQEHSGDVKCVAWCEGGRLPRRIKGTAAAEGSSDHVGQRVGVQEEEDEEEGKVIASRQILASGSYDDTIRLWRDVEDEGDWMCVAVLEGHTGTVWDVCWEKYINTSLYSDPGITDEDIMREWEPRLLSCSDDLTIRTWKRELSEIEKGKRRNQQAGSINGVAGSGQSHERKLPSIIRPTSVFEKWTQDSILPEVHVRSIYAVDWSRNTGLVVSCGGDGSIAVYQEVIVNRGSDEGDIVMNGTTDEQDEHEDGGKAKSKWIVVALMEAAHDEYEINHACWATRRDKGRRFEERKLLLVREMMGT